IVHDNLTPNFNIDPRSIWEMHAASNGKPVSEKPDDLSKVQPVGFKAPGGMVLTTDRPLIRAAIPILFEAWPRTVPFGELLAKARDEDGGRRGHAPGAAAGRARTRVRHPDVLARLEPDGRVRRACGMREEAVRKAAGPHLRPPPGPAAEGGRERAARGGSPQR